MAYINQDQKKKIAALLKVALKDSGLKYSLSINNHSTLVMTVKSATRDFIANHKSVVPNTNVTAHFSVNQYCVDRQLSGKCLEIVKKALEVLNTDNFDESDSMTDYFHVGFYVNLQFGKWDTPFVVTK